MSESLTKIRPSWKSFWVSWILITVTLTAGLLGPGLIKARPELTNDELLQQLSPFLPEVGAAAAALMFIKWIALPWLASRYFFFGQEGKVQEVYGIIRRNRKTTYLQDVRTAQDVQGVWGRIFGFGDVVLYTAGSGEEDIRLKAIGKPVQWAAKFDDYIQGRVGANAEGGHGPRYNSDDVTGESSDTEELNEAIVRLSNRVAEIERSHKSLEATVGALKGQLASAHTLEPEGDEHDHEFDSDEGIESGDSEEGDYYAGEAPMFAQPTGEHAKEAQPEVETGARSAIAQGSEHELATTSESEPEPEPEPATAPRSEFDSDDDLFGSPQTEETASTPEPQTTEHPGEPTESNDNADSQPPTENQRPPVTRRKTSSSNGDDDADSVGILS